MSYLLKRMSVLSILVVIFTLQAVWRVKNHQISIKVAQKWFHKKNERFCPLYKNCLKMYEIWAN